MGSRLVNRFQKLLNQASVLWGARTAKKTIVKHMHPNRVGAPCAL